MLDSKTVENGGWEGGGVGGWEGRWGLLGNGGWAGELLCHGVELEALGAGDGSLFHMEGPGADLEEKTGGTGVETLAGRFVYFGEAVLAQDDDAVAAVHRLAEHFPLLGCNGCADKHSASLAT